MKYIQTYEDITTKDLDLAHEPFESLSHLLNTIYVTNKLYSHQLHNYISQVQFTNDPDLEMYVKDLIEKLHTTLHDFVNSDNLHQLIEEVAI